jgi:hypothetical protein
MTPSPKRPTSPASSLRKQLESPLLAAVSLVIAFLGLTFSAFIPRYATNDDVSMNLIAAGRVFADAPDEHLMFSNVLIGLTLKVLYQAVPEAPWYGGYLLAATALALVAICHVFLTAELSRKQVLLALGFLATFGLNCVVRLQFTTTAFLSALAGLLLLLQAVQGPSTVWRAWAAVPFLVVSSLIRFYACLLACTILAPAIIVVFYRARHSRPGWLAASLLAACLIFGFGLERFNLWYYAQNEDWAGFYEFNALRIRFTDYRRLDYNERTEPILKSVGWSKTDLFMLNSWNFADRERFHAEKLRALLAATKLEDRVMRNRSWSHLVPTLTADFDWLALLSLGAVCLTLMDGWRARIVPFLCLLAAATVALILFSYFYLPRHVYFPAFAAFSAIAIARIPDRWVFQLRTRTWMFYAQAASVLLVVGLIAWRIGAAFEANMNAYSKHQQAVRMMPFLDPRPEQLYVLWGTCFPYDDLVFPLERMVVPREFKAVALGTLTQSSFTNRRLKQFGIADLYQSLYEREDVYLISTPKLNRLLATYLAEHYGIRLTIRAEISHPAFDECRCYGLTEFTPPHDRPASEP